MMIQTTTTSTNRSLATLAFTLVLALVFQDPAKAQVTAVLESREAYVGAPILMQLEIKNARDYELPELPEIDGCDIQPAGTSSNIMYFNGRRTESQIVRYSITPRREGTFEIPPLEIKVDGSKVSTEPLRFVATKSETGDLLFVEIEGDQQRVFVGEPLDLTLNIWIKPFCDRERRVTLSEGDTWNLISKQSEWGIFKDRMQELARREQRPGGTEVLRADKNGRESSYYFYQIKATVYPKRPGQISAEDIQIIVDYPVSLARSRGIFDGFGDSPFKGMMDDPFFASAFDGLRIDKSKPLVAEVKVDATEVSDVPSVGRPNDYRGAVGRYKIETDATPKNVDAGDPITLKIGIRGDGPMELVQAPPLTEISELARDFKVADQSLAGVVEQDAKFFTTSIRPRKEGITQIPAIPFSFFDPSTEKFHTVYSQPISITVNQSESLEMDAIVGKSNQSTAPQKSLGEQSSAAPSHFSNSSSPTLLMSQTPTANWKWLWTFVVAPPLIWLFVALYTTRQRIVGLLQNFRSAYSQCLASINKASEAATITSALIHYVARRTQQNCHSEVTAVGALRASGFYEAALALEQFWEQRDRKLSGSLDSIDVLRTSARAVLSQLESALNSNRSSRIRGARKPDFSNYLPDDAAGAQRMWLLFALSLLSLFASRAQANASSAPILTLSQSQQETIFAEATRLYTQAATLAQDSDEAKQMFAQAASKYQQLVDSGIRNSPLYVNLGNAYTQSGQIGRAIANYSHALSIDPTNAEALSNLSLANSKTKTTSPSGLSYLFSSLNQKVVGQIGWTPVVLTLACSSTIFWGLIIARTIGGGNRLLLFASVPCILLLLSAVSAWQVLNATKINSGQAIVVVDQLRLFAGEGEQFATTGNIDAAQGQRITVLANRGAWMQIRTASGITGWIIANEVEVL